MTGSAEPLDSLAGGIGIGIGIGLVIADVDGTLVDSDKSVTPAAAAAIQKLKDAGVGFTIISGRPPRGMVALRDALGLDLPMAAFNGGSIVEADLTVLETHRLSEAVARQSLEILGGAKVPAWAYSGNDWLLTDPTAPKIQRESVTVGFRPEIVSDFDGVIACINKIVGVSDDHALLQRLGAEIQQMLAGGATAKQSQPYYLDITDPKANKGEGVKALCKHIGVDPARTAVLGDMFNDIAMFGVAGFSVAMGQAPDEVKQAAKAVARTNDADGFADGVERFILPRVAKAGG